MINQNLSSLPEDQVTLDIEGVDRKCDVELCITSQSINLGIACQIIPFEICRNSYKNSLCC